jgi:hypothetical protein
MITAKWVAPVTVRAGTTDTEAASPDEPVAPNSTHARSSVRHTSDLVGGRMHDLMELERQGWDSIVAGTTHELP